MAFTSEEGHLAWALRHPGSEPAPFGAYVTVHESVQFILAILLYGFLSAVLRWAALGTKGYLNLHAQGAYIESRRTRIGLLDLFILLTGPKSILGSQFRVNIRCELYIHQSAFY